MTDDPQFDNQDSLYGYIPTEWICGLFIGLFGLSGLTHIAQALFFRSWWMLPTAALAALGEVIGWSGRLWSSHNAALLDPFLMQISSTIIAPTPLIAANFVILGKLIRLGGGQYSRLGPNTYTIVFCTADVIALVIQAVGGASASTAAENNESSRKGGNIMLAGIAFQLGAIVIYTLFAMEFLYRVSFRKPFKSRTASSPRTSDREPKMQSSESSTIESAGSNPAKTENGYASEVDPFQNKISWMRVKLIVFGLGFSTLCLCIRSIYRTIELSNGFDGPIIHQQNLFSWLDGAMVLLAMYTWNLLHPGWLLPNSRGW